MSVTPNQNKQVQKSSDQEILNKSFDRDFEYQVSMLAGYDIANDRVVRVITDAIGRLASTNDLFIKNISYVISGNGTGKEEYIGYAEPSSLDSSAVWQIQKLLYDANNKLIQVRYADGNLKFDNIWTNRTSLSYS